MKPVPPFDQQLLNVAQALLAALNSRGRAYLPLAIESNARRLCDLAAEAAGRLQAMATMEQAARAAHDATDVATIQRFIKAGLAAQRAVDALGTGPAGTEGK